MFNNEASCHRLSFFLITSILRIRCYLRMNLEKLKTYTCTHTTAATFLFLRIFFLSILEFLYMEQFAKDSSNSLVLVWRQHLLLIQSHVVFPYKAQYIQNVNGSHQVSLNLSHCEEPAVQILGGACNGAARECICTARERPTAYMFCLLRTRVLSQSLPVLGEAA